MKIYRVISMIVFAGILSACAKHESAMKPARNWTLVGNQSWMSGKQRKNI